MGTCPGIARAFTAQGTLVTSGNSSITFRDPRTGDSHRTLAAIGEVVQLALSPKGDVLAYMTDNTLVLAKTTGEKLQQWPSQSNFMRVLAFSPDGSLLAGNTTSDDLNIWRVADGTEVSTKTLDHIVLDLACITPDNRMLYYAAGDAVIHCMTLADGKEGDQLPMLGTPHLITITADGTHLVSADQRVVVWNLATKSTVAELKNRPYPRAPRSLSRRTRRC